jgi:hypothetical protein
VRRKAGGSDARRNRGRRVGATSVWTSVQILYLRAEVAVRQGDGESGAGRGRGEASKIRGGSCRSCGGGPIAACGEDVGPHVEHVVANDAKIGDTREVWSELHALHPRYVVQLRIAGLAICLMPALATRPRASPSARPRLGGGWLRGATAPVATHRFRRARRHANARRNLFSPSHDAKASARRKPFPRLGGAR